MHGRPERMRFGLPIIDIAAQTFLFTRIDLLR